MNKLKKTSIAILMVFSISTYACDVCGCGSSNNSSFANTLGGNFIGFTYNYMYFQYKQGTFANTPLAKDYINTVNISAQYHVTSRFQINAMIPYRFNNRYKASGKVTNSGIGDIVFYGMISLLPKHSNHTLKIGAGLKLPTGKFDLANSSLNKTSAAQLGTGSLDILFPVQYSFRHQELSVNLSAMYFIKNKNKQQYKYGNQTQLNARVSYDFSIKKTIISPIVGITYNGFLPTEQYGIVDHRTSGYMTNATLGVQVEIDKLVIGLNTQRPIAQNLIKNEVTFKQGIGVYTYWRF